MRTNPVDKKLSSKMKKQIREAWESSSGKLYTTEEILNHLERVRTCFTNLTHSFMEDGELSLVQYCLDRIDQITAMFERIENGRAQADLETARTIWAQPILLAKAEDVDFKHLLAEGMVGDA